MYRFAASVMDWCLIWMLLHSFAIVLGYSDYSIKHCEKDGQSFFYFVGLWHQNVTQLPPDPLCKENASLCHTEYAEIDQDTSTDRIHVDLQPCLDSKCSVIPRPELSNSSNNGYSVDYNYAAGSLTVNLTAMKFVSRVIVEANVSTAELAFVRHTISTSPDGINWEPLMKNGKMMTMDFLTNRGRTCVDKKLCGQFIKINLLFLHSLPSPAKFSLEVFVLTGGKTTPPAPHDQIPDKVQFKGCYQLHEYTTSQLINSGLPINQAVNLEECLYRCSFLQYRFAAVSNAVQCACSFTLNFTTSLRQSRCNSVNNKIAASNVYHLAGVSEVATVEIPKQLKFNLIDVMVLHVVNTSTEARTVMLYDLGDGNSGTTCSSIVAHRYGYLGTFNVTLHVLDGFKNVTTITRQVTVNDVPLLIYLNCPTYVVLATEFSCLVTMFQGSSVVVDVAFGDGNETKLKIPDVEYYESGEYFGKTTMIDKSPINGSLALVGNPIKTNGQLLALEFSLTKPGIMRFLVIREKPPVVLPPSNCSVPNQEPTYKIPCNDSNVFVLENSSCCSTSQKTCRQPYNSTTNLTGYIYKRDIIIGQHLAVGYHYIPLGRNATGIFVKKGDILVVVQADLTGTIAKTNGMSQQTTAMIYPPTNPTNPLGTPFPSSSVINSTKEKFAMRYFLSAKRTQGFVYSYNKTGTFSVKAFINGSKCLSKVTVKTQEKIHDVNVTISKLVLASEDFKIVVQANGSDWKGRFNFGDGTKPLQIKSQTVDKRYFSSGVFNITMIMKNVVSTWYQVFQIEVIKAAVIQSITPCSKGIVLGRNVSIAATMDGDKMNISMTLNGVSFSEMRGLSASSQPLVLTKYYTFKMLGEYKLNISARNSLSENSKMCIVYVEIPIKGFSVLDSLPLVWSTEDHFTVSLSIAEGSNVTYTIKMNKDNITYNCSNKNCTKVLVNIKPGTFRAGEYKFLACANNRVTPAACNMTNLHALDPIHDMKLKVKFRIGWIGQNQRFMIYLRRGTEVTCHRWINQHFGSYRGVFHPNVWMIHFLKCRMLGEHHVMFNCSNAVSRRILYSNFTCMHPVRHLLLTSNSPQTLKTGTIKFCINVPRSSSRPSNTSCHVDFGDGNKEFHNECFLPWNFTHKYTFEGHFVVNVTVFNVLTANTSIISVKIQQAVEVMLLKAERSNCDPMHGQPGGGKHLNIFPVECPVNFNIIKIDGTRPNMLWTFGDGRKKLTNNTVKTLQHRCKEGVYNFTVKAFNDVSSLSSSLVYMCKPSVRCYVHEDSPFLTNKPATITIEITNHDHLTAVQVDFGDGTSAITGTTARQHDFPGKDYNKLDPFPKNYILTHLFGHKGEFKVHCDARNSVSRYHSHRVVCSLVKPCRKPRVQISNVGRFSNESNSRNETRRNTVIITTHNTVDCVDSRKTVFRWRVFRHNGPGHNDTHLRHPSWKLNTSKLVIPNGTLPIGRILLEFQLQIVHEVTGGVVGKDTGFFQVLPTKPQVYITGGTSRSEDNMGLKVIQTNFFDADAAHPYDSEGFALEWYTKNDESSPYQEDASVAHPSGCFGYSDGRLPFRGSWFIYDATMIQTDVSCFLRVVATKGSRMASFEQRIDYREGPIPNLQLKCKVNCAYFNPTGITSFEGLSVNTSMSELSVHWNLSSEGVAINLKDKTLTGRHSPSLVFVAGALEERKRYHLTFSARENGNPASKGFVTIPFTTNRCPRNGQCSISPANGSAVLTPFLINCVDWEDEHQPFEYMVFTNAKVPLLLHSGRTLDWPIYLPYNSTSNSSMLGLKVYVQDHHGAYTQLTLEVKVELSEGILQSIDDLMQPNSPLLNTILSGDTQGATQMLNSIASVFTHSANEAGNDTDTLNEFAQKIEFFVNIANSVPCNTPVDVLAISGSLSALTANSKVVNSAVQTQAASIIDKMLSVLKGSALLASVEMQQDACTNILDGLGNILYASTSGRTTQAKGTAKSLMSSLDKIFNLLTSNAAVGQKYTAIDTTHVAILGGIEPLTHLSEDPLQLKSSSFLLPKMDVLQNTLGVPVDYPIVLEMYSSVNPYAYSNSSSSVETDVLSLALGSTSGANLNVSGLSEGIDIEIGNKNYKESIHEVYTVKANGVTTHLMDVATNDSSIHGVIRSINCSVSINVTITVDSTLHYSWTLPRDNVSSGVDPYSFFVSNVELNRTAAGQYSIQVEPANHEYVMNNCMGYLNYTIVTFTASCRYWHDGEETWKGEGCVVLETTSASKVCCRCNHLTAFGGGFFVAPNPIDFSKVLDGFSNLGENPTVFAFVLTIFGVYLILLVWARRADKKDATKVGITILADNDPRDTISYEVTVYTGFNKQASTTADVYLQLIGSLGDSEPRLLKDFDRTKFERGAIDRFLFTVPQSLGDLREIRIWHNNAGRSPGWFLFRMQIKDCQTQKKWWFVCNKWLAVDEDDGRVERRIKTATKSDLTQFNVLFVNATRKNLLDGHLWLSVYTRPPQSTFTRVQRLSCCLSLLLCTMLTNAMFFQTGGGSQDTTIKLGPIRLSWSLIMIGIQSSIVVMPVNVLIVSIFRKLEPKESKDKKYEVTRTDPTEYYGSSSKVVVDEAESCELDIEPDRKKSSIGFLSKEKPKEPKKKFMFPHWCIFVAYALCFISSLTSGAFTIFYGFTFGKVKSEKWLTSMIISLFQSVIVIQPFKVLLLAMFFALIIKDPNKEEEDLGDDMTPEDTRTGSPLIETGNKSTRMALFNKPPEEEKLRKARALRLKEKQMMSIVREIVLHFMVVILVLFVAYGNQDDKSFVFSRQATDLLAEGMQPFSKITNHDEYWDWALSVLLPNLYPVDELIGYPYMDIMYNKGKSNMVGIGRLRQLRNKKNTCKVPLIFSVDISECNEEYSWSNEDTNNYKPGWKLVKPSNNTLPSTLVQDSSWKYVSAWELKGSPYFGNMAMYRGGGYIVGLGPTNTSAFNSLKTLRNNNWIDKYTRGIFTEINIYNVDVNLLCVITLLYEFIPSTSGVYTINVQTIKLFRYLDGLSKAVMGFEVIFMFLAIYWIYRDIKKIFRERYQYLKSIWNIVDSVITLLSVCAIGFYFGRLASIYIAIKQFHGDRKRFVNFQYVVLLNEVMNAITAFIVMICNMKFLRLLRFNRKVSMLSDTLRHSSSLIFSFFLMIFIVIFAFCCMATLTFGYALEGYRTIIRSSISFFSMMLGDFHFENLESAHRVIGPLMFFIFMVFVQFILVNMFVGILSDSFDEVRTDTSKQSNEYEIVEFISRKLVSFFGMFGGSPIQPEYIWPKNLLELHMQSIDEKTDTIMTYMRNLCDEDLRTVIWLESDKPDKLHKILVFASKNQHMNVEDEFFDGVPILIKFMNALPQKELDKYFKDPVDSPQDECFDPVYVYSSEISSHRGSSVSQTDSSYEIDLGASRLDDVVSQLPASLVSSVIVIEEMHTELEYPVPAYKDDDVDNGNGDDDDDTGVDDDCDKDDNEHDDWDGDDDAFCDDHDENGDDENGCDVGKSNASDDNNDGIPLCDGPRSLPASARAQDRASVCDIVKGYDSDDNDDGIPVCDGPRSLPGSARAQDRASVCDIVKIYDSDDNDDGIPVCDGPRSLPGSARAQDRASVCDIVKSYDSDDNDDGIPVCDGPRSLPGSARAQDRASVCDIVKSYDSDDNDDGIPVCDGPRSLPGSARAQDRASVCDIGDGDDSSNNDDGIPICDGPRSSLPGSARAQDRSISIYQENTDNTNEKCLEADQNKERVKLESYDDNDSQSLSLDYAF